jgi:hypothetical protein
LALNTCMLGNATFSLIARFDGIGLNPASGVELLLDLLNPLWRYA